MVLHESLCIDPVLVVGSVAVDPKVVGQVGMAQTGHSKSAKTLSVWIDCPIMSSDIVHSIPNNLS